MEKIDPFKLPKRKNIRISEKKLYQYLNIFGEGFKTGDYSKFYPLLTDDCILEERTGGIYEYKCTKGKDKIINIFETKEKSEYEFHEVVYGIGDRINDVKKMEYLFGKIVEKKIIIENIGEFKRGYILTREQIKMLPVTFYREKKLRLLVNQFFRGEYRLNSVIIMLETNEKNLISCISICSAAYYEVEHYNRDSEERTKKFLKNNDYELKESDLQVKAVYIAAKYLSDKIKDTGEKIIYIMDGFEMTPHIITADKNGKLTHYCVEGYIEGTKKPGEIHQKMLNYWSGKADSNYAKLRLLSVAFIPKSKTIKDKLYLNSRYTANIKTTIINYIPYWDENKLIKKESDN